MEDIKYATLINENAVVGNRMNEYVVEASKLGFEPDVFPNQIDTTIGNSNELVASKKKLDAQQNIVYVRYVQKDSNVQLIVMND